ncbi:MAG TPA: trypsin-like serine protease, partial [Chlamydiales bacterium]|nr:trypsin-like serine protease [Chlamydiales bacterium]
MSMRIIQKNFSQNSKYKEKNPTYLEHGRLLFLSPHIPKKSFAQAPIVLRGESLNELFEERLSLRNDRRTRVQDSARYPNSINVHLSTSFNDRNSGGSGAMVGPHHILTTAHNVYDVRSQSWAERITVCPGRNGDLAPFGKVTVDRAYIFSDWTKKTDRGFDIALLILSESVGEYTGWAGVVSTSDNEIQTETVQITGYPSDKGFKELWRMQNKVNTCKTEEFDYAMDDTYPRQSGSPIWVEKFGQAHIIGVHTLEENFKSIGVRISALEFKDLLATYIFKTHKIISTSTNQVSQPSYWNLFWGLFGNNPAETIVSPIDPSSTTVEEPASIHQAIQFGNIDALVRMLGSSKGISDLDEYGDTPLHLAVKRANQDLEQAKFFITALLFYGSKPEIKDVSGETAHQKALGYVKHNPSMQQIIDHLRNLSNPQKLLLEVNQALEKWPKEELYKQWENYTTQNKSQLNIRSSRPYAETEEVNFVILPGEQTSEYAFQMLGNWPKLNKLSLESNKLSNEEIKVLAQILPSLSQLKALDFSRYSLGLEGAKALAMVLGNTGITELNLNTNRIGVLGASALANVLEKTIISQLNLNCNSIGAKGASALANVLEKTIIT